MKKFRETLMTYYEMRVYEIDKKIENNQHDWGLVGLLKSEREVYIEKIDRLKEKLKKV